MLHIKVYDAAGSTNGRPAYNVAPQFNETTEVSYARVGVIEGGAFDGSFLAEKIEGSIDIFQAPFGGVITAYNLSIREGTVDTVQLYRETYDNPISVTPYENVEGLLAKADLQSAGGIEFEGNEHANVFTANSGNDRLFGEGGNDRLDGRAGNDLISGGTGADTMFGGVGNDVLIVNSAGDRVVELAAQGLDRVTSFVSHTLGANVEDLTLVNEDAATNGGGNALANTLRGSLQNNVLNGGRGADTLIGSRGNDSYVVDNAGDSVLEAASRGTDTVVSTVSHALAANVEHLTLAGTAALNGRGTAGANVLRGNTANNVLNGNAGNDRLIGAAGDDVLVGAAGRDLMSGEAGADSFRFLAAGDTASGSARDAILDFASGTDRIDLGALDASALTAGNQAFTFIGAGAFSGAAGELRQTGGVLEGNMDADPQAEFQIGLAGAPAVAAGDLVL